MPTSTKSTKKAPTPKKQVVRKTTSRKAKKHIAEPQRPLVEATAAQAFWVTDGQVLMNLCDLRDAFATMSTAVYAYHTGAHNDFARWVAEVLCDAACADELHTAASPDEASAVVLRHLAFYTI